MTVTVNGRVFQAVLNDSAAAQAFADLLPAAFELTELNGNEKYYRFPDERFPVTPESVEQIQTGDLCIYQDDYLVLFYKTFSTSYQYTRLGRITDPEGLEEALGSGNVRVEITISD